MHRMENLSLDTVCYLDKYGYIAKRKNKKNWAEPVVECVCS